MTATMEAPEEADYRELLANFQQMTESAYGAGAARRVLEGAEIDRAAWARLAQEFGLVGLQVPESLGGPGASFVYASLAARAAGALVLPAPVLSTGALAVSLILAAARADGAEEVLAPILSGERVIAVAGVGSGLAGTRPDLTIDQAAGQVSGGAAHVQFGHVADAILAIATDDNGAAVVAIVEQGAAGLVVSPRDAVDPTRPLSAVSFDATPANILGTVTPDALSVALSRATVLAASASIGGARAALDLALAYVRVRHQFGRPIGSFQALQHLLVGLFADVEASEATVDWAAALLDASTDVHEVRLAASLAKITAAEAYSRVSREALHAHGGIGFTWEHDAQLHLKRALADRALLGTPSQHRRLIAASWGGGVPDGPARPTDGKED